MNKVWLTTTIFFILIFVAWYLMISYGKDLVKPNQKAEIHEIPIAPSLTHPQYWSMNGQDIMLLGGSVEDNLFQLPDFTDQLELLQSIGGNYVRNTMSSRDSSNLWPFLQDEQGIYDLNKWNDAYWQRFDQFLAECSRRDIVVQIELWATFDFYREPWSKNPFNPLNNKNYNAERVHLPTEVKTHPTWVQNDFFRSVPNQQCNLKLLEYQQKYIDKLLSYSLAYGNVLYCMDNETSVTAEWGKFWSLYIKNVAKEQGKQIYTTEMWDPWDLGHAIHRETTDHPEIYDFVDISQNNHNTDDSHWENGLKIINRLETGQLLRPINNVKVYGNDGGNHQTTQNAIDAFVRNVLMGCASTRFHRPTSGQGLNKVAQGVIKSMRMVVEKGDFFNGHPANHLLTNREKNEAYCRELSGSTYILYFPKGGEVTLDLSTNKPVNIEWIQVDKSAWSEKTNLTVKDKSTIIKTPTIESWLAYLTIN